MKSDKAAMIEAVTDTALQIVKDEHDFFVAYFFVAEPLDNSEHISRIIRIANSAGKLLSGEGIGGSEAKGIVNRIIQFGRQLFIQEWMRPLSDNDEDDPPNESDAIAAFDKIAKKSMNPAQSKRSRKTLDLGEIQLVFPNGGEK